jgi:hypothetical protein
MKLSASAKHKTLKRTFKVIEIDLAAQRVKCEGHVEKGICVLCQVTEEGCDLPWFKLNDVELEITKED